MDEASSTRPDHKPPENADTTEYFCLRNVSTPRDAFRSELNELEAISKPSRTGNNELFRLTQAGNPEESRSKTAPPGK